MDERDMQANIKIRHRDYDGLIDALEYIAKRLKEFRDKPTNWKLDDLSFTGNCKSDVCDPVFKALDIVYDCGGRLRTYGNKEDS